MDYNFRKEDTPVPGTIARAASMKKIYQKADTLAQNQASVLIYGETGVGKNHLAQYIQKQGNLAHAPFIRIHCNAVPSDLFASELFGYSPNAFTGASVKGKIGLLEASNHGTVLFDEINELSPENQTLLLHFLQNSNITPIGSLKSKQIQTRIICTSGQDLNEMVYREKFRLDLYYRICVAKIYIPPLRERRDEIPLFLRHFITHFAKEYPFKDVSDEITEEHLSRLSQLYWRGNIREIENLAQTLCLAEHPQQTLETFFARQEKAAPSAGKGGPQAAARTTAPSASAAPIRPLKEAMQEFERSYIQNAIEQAGSLSAAARLLDISYSSLCRKKTELGIGR